MISSENFIILQKKLSDPDLQAPFNDLDSELTLRYPSYIVHGVDPSRIYNRKSCFLVVYSCNNQKSKESLSDGQTEPIGCGCFIEFSDTTCELKRLFVKSEYRRRGIARQILEDLENRAKMAQFFSFILETGSKQLGAKKMYQSLGYLEIPSWGYFLDFGFSIFLGKQLEPSFGEN